MAAFSTMALLAGGMLAGAGAAKLASKKQTPGNPTAPLAPGPTGQTTATTPASPAPPIVNPSEAQATAQQAGSKAKKRAAAGSLVANQLAPKSSTMPVPGRTRPRTLIGGY